MQVVGCRSVLVPRPPEARCSRSRPLLAMLQFVLMLPCFPSPQVLYLAAAMCSSCECRLFCIVDTVEPGQRCLLLQLQGTGLGRRGGRAGAAGEGGG